ncbi:lysozyme [Novosphingobium sp. SL115]|uniref:lysozyme n=1 Tax=Novosphingobium sp. SL115 TaxID=2995150 RepID=UPI002272FDA3|nr:lysozyme [Novosphingobium sp. SL115]MCY1672121.1 lysozyme [Novosphingobium sp. SL115]
MTALDPRKTIFDAVRAVARPGLFADAGNILALDNLLDAFNVPHIAQAKRRINDAGLAIIKQYEGLRLKAYLCPAGIWTIGWGHTGPDVKAGKSITLDRAEQLLRADLSRFEAAVQRLAPVATDNQFSAMVSFAFNVGEDEDEDDVAEGLGDSTLLRKHNAGDFAGAAAQFAKWNKAKVNGKTTVLKGLTDRRAREAALYAKPD